MNRSTEIDIDWRERFSIAADKEVHVLGPGSANSGIDVRQAVVERLGSPNDFPPLCEAIIPGDRIALAVGRAIPQIAGVVSAVVEYLASQQVEHKDISVVFSSAITTEEEEAVVARLTQAGWGEIATETHSVAGEEANTFLAATDEGLPLLGNRVLADADFVLPIGVATGLADGEFNWKANLFPGFADEAMISHIEELASKSGSNDELERLSSSFHSRIGAFAALQLVPGIGDQVANLFFGSMEYAVELAETETVEIWQVDRPVFSDLVIANVPTMETVSPSAVAHAISQAKKIVGTPGAIVVNLLGEEAVFSGRLSDDLREEWENSAELSQTLSGMDPEQHVFLLSQFEEEWVEQLGLGSMTDLRQLGRLADAYPHCVVIADSLRCVLRMPE